MVSSWPLSPEPELPQALRLHLSALIPLLPISSVCLGSFASLPPSLSSPGPHPPGQQPSPSGWCCSPSAPPVRPDSRYFCNFKKKKRKGEQSRKLKLSASQVVSDVGSWIYAEQFCVPEFTKFTYCFCMPQKLYPFHYNVSIYRINTEASQPLFPCNVWLMLEQDWKRFLMHYSWYMGFYSFKENVQTNSVWHLCFSFS